jgi:glucokinase
MSLVTFVVQRFLHQSNRGRTTTMLLAGDVGGTKTHLALYSASEGPVPQAEATYASAEYPSLEAIAARFLAGVNARVEAAAFGVAGPVAEGLAVITNLPWVISETGLQRALDVPSVTLLNDLEATAYGIPHLSPADLATVNDVPGREGTKAVVAPGTGLGEAVLFYQDGRYHVIPSEGGHVDFAPTNLLEIELLRYLLGKFGHVSYERVCSGKGIPNLYAYFKENRLAEELPEIAALLKEGEDPTPAIVDNAMNGRCELCMATLSTFVSILGAEAGNLALKVRAEGGVYLGGGIPPRILSKLRDGTFMAAFVNKGRFGELLSRIPVYVILRPDTPLLGAACYGLGL